MEAQPTPLTILVVDDEPDVASLMRDFLEAGGYHVVTAPDGPGALAALAAGPVDCVLLDVMMPGLSGFEVLERMPRNGTPPRVVFLTSAAAQDVGGALRTGPHYYLPKGASRDQLSLLLQSLEH